MSVPNDLTVDKHVTPEAEEAEEPGEPVQKVGIAPDAFFESGYRPNLRALVDEILHDQAPLPFERLAREISKRHGWKRTGSRIKSHLRNVCRHIDFHQENGRDFIWPSGGYKDRVPFRGLKGRRVQDVSRTELASLLDEILPLSPDHISDFARQIGIRRLYPDARQYLESVLAWYFEDV